MSSLRVRNLISNFVRINIPTETLIDLTAEFDDIEDVVQNAGISDSSPWLGIQYFSGGELPVDILATNTKGKYRETGMAMFHIVDIAKQSHDAILERAEGLRDKFRGQRIGNLVIESVSPPAFGSGSTLSFEGGYMAATVSVEFHYDLVIG